MNAPPPLDHVDTIKQGSNPASVLAFPTLYPREILTALGISVREVWAGSSNIVSTRTQRPAKGVGGRLQPYLCPMIQQLQAILELRPANLDPSAVIIPHTCDSMQGLASIGLHMTQGWGNIVTFRHPRGTDVPSARLFLRGEVQAFIQSLEGIFGRKLELERLREATELHRRVERLLGTILEQRPWLPLGDAELYAILRMGEWMHPADYALRLERLQQQLEPAGPRRSGIGLVVSGMVPEPRGFFEVLEGAGAFVAADDYAAIGRRVAAYEGSMQGDPLGAVVERLLLRPPCPTRSTDARRRISRLISLARRSQAQGVILHTVKFCEPELFDVPVVREALERQGLKVLHVETELEDRMTGQMTTRLEAFIEMLQPNYDAPVQDEDEDEDEHEHEQEPAAEETRSSNLAASLGKRMLYEGAVRAASGLVWTERVAKSLRTVGKPRKESAFGPPLRTTYLLKEVLARHYVSGRYASGAVPVAWVTSGFPVEFLRPFGYHVVYPENHAAMCGVQRMGVELAQQAEQWGLSRDVCGYARCDIGSFLSGKTPVGKIPRPDILLACTNICQTVLFWYRTLAKLLNVPLVVIDTPFQYGEPDAHAEAYVARQIEEAVSVAARVARKTLRWKELAEVCRISREASLLWRECLAMSKVRPAPWTGFDQFLHLGPIVAMRGLPECTRYYEVLRNELSDRVRMGVGAVRDERYRLLWDNLPVWYELKSLSQLLASSGFNIVTTTYTHGWAETAALFDPKDPVHSAARVYSRVFINRGLDHRLRLFRNMMDDFECEGVLLHSNHSCKPYSVGQLDLARQLTSSSIRTLVLDADHIDARVYAKEQVEGRIAAFMESFPS